MQNSDVKIAACMIVKDDSELPSLVKAVKSIIYNVDSIYITTTGKQVKDIKKFCLNNNINYSHFKWIDDFSATRTFNFSQVKEKMDFIFWMDADDILIGGENLKIVAQQSKEAGKDVVFFTYWYGCRFEGEPIPENMVEVEMEQMRERLLKPGVTVWKKRLHETPVPISGVKNNYTSFAYDPEKNPIVVMHTAEVDDKLKIKMVRNKRILELELDDERKNGQIDPRTLLYLMKIYAVSDDPVEWDKCISMGEEYLPRSGWNEERATCLENMGIAWEMKGNHQEAIKCFHKAIAEWPLQPLIHIRLATSYFNVKEYKFAQYWMDIALKMDIDNKGSNLTNIKAMKLMSADLMLKLNYNYHRDTKKSLESAKLVYKEDPNEQHMDQLVMLDSLDRLNDACKNFDDLTKYLAEIKETKNIVPILELLPEALTAQPFVHKLRQVYSQPKQWASNEICYFANFGQKHFESWDMSSLKSGLGGSETAVLELSRQWTKLGYKVTIYGDPKTKGGQDGVTILPWFYFNPYDNFNIFIQWRNGSLANTVKCKKFYVDLHDVWSGIDYLDYINKIDKFMVKSNYHKELAMPEISEDKFLVIGNGINE